MEMILKMINIGAGPQIYMYIFNYFPIRVCDSNQEVRTCMYLSGPHLSFPHSLPINSWPPWIPVYANWANQTNNNNNRNWDSTRNRTKYSNKTKKIEYKTVFEQTKSAARRAKNKKIVFLSWWRSLCLVLCFTTQIWGVYGGYIVATVPQLNWEGMKRVTGLFIPYFRPYFDFVY